MLTLVSLKTRVIETDGSITHLLAVVLNSFPLSTEWETSTKSTYRIDRQGVVRCKRPKIS